MIKNNEIVRGFANARNNKNLLMNSWKKKYVLKNNRMSFFRNDIWNFRSLLRRRRFWKGSPVVIRPDKDVSNNEHV